MPGVALLTLRCEHNVSAMGRLLKLLQTIKVHGANLQESRAVLIRVVGPPHPEHGIGARVGLDDVRHRDEADEGQHKECDGAEEPAGAGEGFGQRQGARAHDEVEDVDARHLRGLRNARSADGVS